MQYTAVIRVETDQEPARLRNELVSALEFDHNATVRSVLVLNEQGVLVAAFNCKQRENDNQVRSE